MIFTLTSSQRLVFGSFLILLSILLFLSIISYLFSGEIDQSSLTKLYDRSVSPKNWLSKLGSWISHLLVYKGFGVMSIYFAILTATTGISVLASLSQQKLINYWFWGTLIIVWFSIVFGFIDSYPNLGGMIGYEMNLFFQDYTGKIGTIMILMLCLIIYLAVRIKLTPQDFLFLFKTKKN